MFTSCTRVNGTFGVSTQMVTRSASTIITCMGWFLFHSACPCQWNCHCPTRTDTQANVHFLHQANQGLAISHFPQNGLVWACHALSGRCWVHWNGVPLKCGRVSCAPREIQELVTCQQTMYRHDIALRLTERMGVCLWS